MKTKNPKIRGINKMYKINLYGFNFKAEFEVEDINPIIKAMEKKKIFILNSPNQKKTCCYNFENLQCIEILEIGDKDEKG